MPRSVPDMLQVHDEFHWMKGDGQEPETLLRSWRSSQAFVAQSPPRRDQEGDKLRGCNGVKMDWSLQLFDDY